MKHFLLIFISFISLNAIAQTDTLKVVQNEPAANEKKCVMTFGFLSYDAAIKAMPEYATAQQSVQELKKKYDAEVKRVEEDFNKKYESFLDGQSEFPPTILKKRQAELKEMLVKNIAFKKESERLLAAAEKEIFAPLHTKLAELLKIIAEDRGYSFIINTDNNACPYINPSQGEDINSIVLSTLQEK